MKLPFVKFYVLLRKYLAPFKKQMALLLTLLLLDILFTLINPQIIRYYIDTFDLFQEGLVSTSQANDRLFEAAILYVGIALIQQICFLGSVYFSQTLAWKSTNKLRLDVTTHCVYLDMTFHNQYTPGKMIERVDGDVTTLSTFFSQFILLIAANTIQIIAILVILFVEFSTIGLVFTVFTISMMLILYKIWNTASPYWKKVRQTSSDLLGYVEEVITSKEDVVANGAQEFMYKKFHDYSNEEYSAQVQAVLVSRMVHVGIMSIFSLGTLLVFILGIPLYYSGDISFGTLFLINSYIGILITPIIQIVRGSQELTQADASINRLNELFAIQSTIENIGKTELPEDDALDLEFRNVSFSYCEKESTLENISFKIKKGTKLGLIGRTGSGKTTISRLIFRLYNPNSGDILFNNRKIQDLNLVSLRKKVAYVTQKVELFKATVRNNITFFEMNESSEKIEEIIKELELVEWYNRLPNGLETELSGETGFSAGEAQLLALTRVFLKDPQFIILDEASSRLDPITDRLIDKAISKLLHEKTAIIIAHRLKTLEHVDEIMLLERGKIIEYGKREDLIKNPNSNFSKLLRSGIEEVLA